MTDADLAGAPDETIVLFDGLCNLCNGTVRFLLRRDRRRRLRFAALQSSAGRRLLAQHGWRSAAAEPAASATGGPESIVVIDAGRAFVASAAALRIARRLPWPWPLLGAFAVLPRPLRDALYRFIARHRYRWFGRIESCRLPTAGTADRFLR